LAESAFVGATDSAGISPASSVTYYGNYGNSVAATQPANTNEAHAAIVHRGSDCVLQNLRARLTTNSRAANSTITTQKNGSATSQVVTITASTTGTYTDLTNTVSLTAGDTYSYALAIGATSGTLLLNALTAELESTGQSVSPLSCFGTVSLTTASATRYIALGGRLQSMLATESEAQLKTPVAGSWSHLRLYVTAARATTTTVRSRKNSANGNQLLSITGTGAFEDTSNSDTVAAGDNLSISLVTGSGADTLTIVNASSTFTPSTAGASVIAAPIMASTSASAGANRFNPVMGRFAVTSTESTVQAPAPFDGTASYLTYSLSANASTVTSNITLRKAGADTAVTIAITAGATGLFADTSNSVAVSTGDLLSVKISDHDGTLTPRGFALRYTQAVTEITGTLAATLGAVTPSAAGVVAIVGEVASTLGAATSSATGVVAIAGEVNATLGAVTLEASSEQVAYGALSATLGDAAATGAGTVSVTGSASPSLGALGTSAAGTVLVGGSAAPDLGAVTASSSGAVSVSGAASLTLGAVAASAAGAVSVIGAATPTLAPATIAAAGAVTVAGEAGPTLGLVTTTGAGAVSIAGAASLTLGEVTLSASAGQAALGELDGTLGAITASSAGLVAVAGTAAPALGAVGVTASGAISLTGSAAPELGTLTTTATAAVAVSGAATQTLGAVTAVATGGPAATGASDNTLGAVTVLSSGTLPIAGTTSTTLGVLTGASTGALAITAAASAVLGSLASAAAGAVQIVGTAASTLGALVLSAFYLDPLVTPRQRRLTLAYTSRKITLLSEDRALSIPYVSRMLRPGAGNAVVRKGDLILLTLPKKFSSEVLDYQVDWQALLSDDTILTVTITPSDGLVLGDISTAGGITTFWLSAGTAGANARIGVIGVTAQGRTHKVLISMQVQ